MTSGRLKFRLCQILLNAVGLLAIAGGLAAYFNAYPTIKFVNQTITRTAVPASQPGSSAVGGGGAVSSVPASGSGQSAAGSPGRTALDVAGGFRGDRNPAPGVCLPVIVKFCQQHRVPYNYTVFPNYIGHFGQPEAQIVSNLTILAQICAHHPTNVGESFRKLISSKRWSMCSVTSLFHCSYALCLCLNAVIPVQPYRHVKVCVLVSAFGTQRTQADLQDSNHTSNR